MAKRLQIELPVCPEPTCLHVGKVPVAQSLRGYCTGSASKGTAHKKRRMVPVEFSGAAPEGGRS